MNFLAGMILIGVNFEEVTAFTIFDHLMREKDWRRVYCNDLSGLFPLTDYVYSWLMSEHPVLEAHF